VLLAYWFAGDLYAVDLPHEPTGKLVPIPNHDKTLRFPYSSCGPVLAFVLSMNDLDPRQR
jgi:hypothetical protein